MDGQTIESGKLSFIESSTKFKATREAVNSGGLKLIAAANNHRLIFIGFEDKTIKAINIDNLIEPSSTINPNQFIFTHQLAFRPTLLSVSRHGHSSVLLVTGIVAPSGAVATIGGGHATSVWPAVELFDIDTREPIGKLELKELSGSRIVDYSWHPTYCESIVVLCTDKGHLLVIGFDRKDKRVALVYKNDQYGALTCCWSPKGKNLAIGMSNGNIIRLELVVTPSSFTLKEVKNSTLTFSHEKITSEHRVIKLRWLVKTSLICIHARPVKSTDETGGPDTIYSIMSIKPGKPYKYWSNLCFEKAESYYDVQLINLMSHVVCIPNSSSEAAVLGVDSNEEAKANEPNNWNAIVVEGERIELPLDDNNREMFSRGVTLTYMRSNTEVASNRPILVFLTSGGTLCSYTAVHSDGILKLPELQELEECPLSIPKAIPAPIVEHRKPQELRPSTVLANNLDLSTKPVVNVIPRESMSQMERSINDIKKGIKQNESAIHVLGEINQLRTQFDEIQDIHKTHREALDAINADIGSLDLGMLENHYLLEYIKTRSKGASRKKSLNPRIVEKVETIKQKSKQISEKLRDLNAHVDVSWEDFVRRRNALENKDRRLNSLDVIYKTLATNQKIINLLKTKSAHLAGLPPTPKAPQINCDTARLELDPVRMRALRDFLASRTVVPVRRPL